MFRVGVLVGEKGVHDLFALVQPSIALETVELLDGGEQAKDIEIDPAEEDTIRDHSGRSRVELGPLSAQKAIDGGSNAGRRRRRLG
jgi:hypothetical protein